jgi:hypothetical protein
VARAVPTLELHPVAADAFRADDVRHADVAVFHGFVPADSPAVNSLYLYPPAANALFRSQRDVVGAQILDWNDADPVLHDLRYVEALPLARARMLELPPWAHTLIASRAEGQEFPLAFAGETSGRRVICFAFDLAGRSLVKSENLSLLLLMLNSLRWLTPPDPASPVQVDVGDSYRETLPAPRPLSIAAPDGSTETRPAKPQIALEISRVGEYRLTAGGEQRSIYANLFDADESDIGRPSFVAEETVDGKEAPSGDAVVSATLLHELGRALLWIGLLLALAEWATWARLERGRGSSDGI